MTTRHLTAILAADIAGYSSLMGADEERTVEDLKAHQSIILPLVSESEGRVIDTAGDGLLAEFPSTLNAVKCAIAIQEGVAGRNVAVSADRAMQFRIGINQGDVVLDENRIYGDGINVAARLEAIAEPGGICISGKVFEEVRDRLGVTFEDWGERQLKNIARPTRVFAWRPAAQSPVKVPSHAAHQLSLTDAPSIAVLPFQNMSGDPEQDYFADGIVEDITTALSQLRWLFVIARNSSFTYKGRSVDVKQVGRELGVRYVLEGSVRKSGNRVRITGQLIEAALATHVWAEKFDGDLADIFDLQDRITESIVGAIEPSLLSAEIARAEHKPTASLDAYDLYLRAFALYGSMSRSTIRTAISLLEAAIAIDPNYARAEAVACLCHGDLVQQRWDEPGDFVAADRLARQALDVSFQ